MPNNEWGDFQTPPELVDQVLAALPAESWGRALEPTSGVGNFLRAATLAYPTAEVVGIEQNEDYVSQTVGYARVLHRSIFHLNLAKQLDWGTRGPLLVVGNPPWVTNAGLTGYGSINRPERRNMRNLRGLDALTGASNFDIAEYIWIKLIVELADEHPTIALLCKTHVARNVLSYCALLGIGLRSANIRRIDAKRWFDAAVDACLFTVEVGGDDATPACPVYDSLDAAKPVTRIGIVEGLMVSNIDEYAASRTADGQCPIPWRQGVKHDASAVMELKCDGDKLVNGLGQLVDIELNYALPMLKCTDVFKGAAPGARRMIVPQRALREDTNALRQLAPKLWEYLQSHSEALDARKSSIYKGRPRFSVFGIGPYTFAPWKIAISGFHKAPRFRLFGPFMEQPVVFDDVCYMLPFGDGVEAAAVYSLLTAPEASQLLDSLVFWDAKRPITKKLLARIDLAAVAGDSDRAQLGAIADASLRAAGADDFPDWSSVFDDLMTSWCGESVPALF